MRAFQTEEEENAYEAFAKALNSVPLLCGDDSVEKSPFKLAREETIVSKEIKIPSRDGDRFVEAKVVLPKKRVPSEYAHTAIYLHGGGMALFDYASRNFENFARVVALQGVVVVMVGYRNSLRGSKTVAPFPAGLNDCVDAVRYLSLHSQRLGIPPGKFVLFGESGGANLSIATALALKREKHIDLVAGIFAMCPYVSGDYVSPRAIERYPSLKIFDGVGNLSLASLHFYAAAYGDDLVENPLAWPSCATSRDLSGLPPVHVSVNEFDPLRDEGVELYRKCLAAGISATCSVEVGTIHGIGSFFPGVDPDTTRYYARSVASMCRVSPGAAK